MNFKLKKPGKACKNLSRGLLVVSTFFLGLIVVGGEVMMEQKDIITDALGQNHQTVIKDPNSARKDKEYFKTAFKSVKEVMHNGEVYNESLVKEGVTLLKNENNALPLKKDAKVSLFSTSSVSCLLTATRNANQQTVSLKDGLEEQGIGVNTELYTWYEDHFGEYGRKAGTNNIANVISINDARWDEIGTDAKTNSAYGDAAIFVLSRGGGEGRDCTIASSDPKITSDFQDGNYLKLSQNERNVLENLKKEKDKGTFKKIIVMMNTANQVQCDFVDDPTLGIDAFMWVGTYGEYGARAIGKLMTGKYNFSGKLPDTFWKYHYLNPVHSNFSVMSNGSENYTQHTTTRKAAWAKHVVYKENVYVGYRYTETRYEDIVMGRENVGEYDYSNVVSYPFGYGLSYTKFDYSDFKVEKIAKNQTNALKEDTYKLSVKVTNTGSVDGKEAVQMYVQKPYTEYDILHHIEKPAVELVGYNKTKILKPGESQVLEVLVGESKLTSYDSYEAKTYILENGDYYFTAGKDSHDAINNILSAKGKSIKDGMTKDGDSTLTYKFNVDTFDKETYSKSLVTGNPITNHFDNADLKIYDGAGANKNAFEYTSRNNWKDTTTFGMDINNVRTNNFVNVVATEKMQKDLDDNYNPVTGEGNEEYPKYGTGKETDPIQLITLRAYDDEDEDPTNDKLIPYDDPRWDELLDQVTFDETVYMLSNGYRRTLPLTRFGKPETIDQNGSNGVIVPYNEMSKVSNGLAVRKNDPNKHKKPVIYCSNSIIAATYNKSLQNFYGRQWGEDMLWAGLEGLYGMGVNTHRSPYAGRCYHYYSEDPLLTGQTAAQVTKGMRTRGAYPVLKHAFLNEQETYRQGVYTWANEQSCREIYLKTFQIAIEEGGASCVMTGMNSIGCVWSGGQGFVNNCLRNEFGMKGYAVTDTYTAYSGSATRGILAGNDLPDGGRQNWENLEYVRNGGYSKMAWAMRESVHRILYNTVHSFAMNGIGSDTRIIKEVPTWPATLQGVTAGISTVFALSLAFWGSLVGLEVLDYIKNKKGVK